MRKVDVTELMILLIEDGTVTFWLPESLGYLYFALNEYDSISLTE